MKASSETVQNQVKEFEAKIQTLSKYNSNLQDQVSKYAVLLAEEKNERKEVLSKYETLQSEFATREQTFGMERTTRTKKYYTLLVVTAIL